MASNSVQTFLSWRDRGRDRALTAMLIVECFVIFVAAPCVAAGYPGSRTALELGLFSFAFLIIVVSRGRITTTIAVIAMIAALTGTLLTIVAPSRSMMLLSHVGTISGSIVAGFVIGRAVLAPGVVTRHRIIGAIVLYLNFGLIFSTAYRLIWDFDPNSLTGLPSGTSTWQASAALLYFSFVTLTSVGFGDVVPVHPFTRSLSNLEAIIGQLYPATLLARLITLELAARRRRQT